MARCHAVFYLLIATVMAKHDGDSNPDEHGRYEGGDMVLTPEQMGIIPKAGIKGANYRWPKGRIPYVIDKGFTANERRVIMTAINEIQSKTCVRLNPRGSEVDYITIFRGARNSGCYSNVGRVGGNQKVNIEPGTPGCVRTGTIAHEIIHAIGFYHEQSRSDRDDFVTISYQNIKERAKSNFDKYSTSQVDPFGVSYDYGSIMHYSPYAFSVNGKATITAKKSDARNMGQRSRLSVKDAQKINNMYNSCK